MSKPVKIGLALGSGGARGWCHIGVIQALEALGIEPVAVAGTSMGAVVGAAWAGGRLADLDAWVRGLSARRFVRLMDITLRPGGLVEARGIEAMLGEIGLPARIEELDRPFTAIATDMESGREVWLATGPTARVVRASAGIPGVMTPVRHDDRWLLDGGLTNPVPVSAARALGAEVILAVDPNAGRAHRLWTPSAARDRPAWAGLLPPKLSESLGFDQAREPRGPSYIEVLNTAIDTMTKQILRARLAGEPPHVLLGARLDHMSVLELYRGAEAIEEGHRMVARHEAEIREACGL